MELRINDYVRTKHYGISKITDIYNEDKIELDNVNAFGIKGVCYMTENIIKSSPRIIDLIQVGDYVNGHKVIYTIGDINRKIYIEYVNMNDLLEIRPEQIKSIVTKQQFSQMEYKIGDE